MILPSTYQSYWVLCSAFVKTLVCFMYLLEIQCHFNKFYNIDMTDAFHIFIELHTSLTPLPEAIGLHAVIWQAPHTVRHSRSLSFICCCYYISIECVCVCIYVCMYVCMCVYISIYIRIYYSKWLCSLK